MHHEVDRSRHVERLGDVCLEERAPGMCNQLVDHRSATGEQIVHGDDLAPVCELPAAEPSIQEAGGPGDDHPSEG